MAFNSLGFLIFFPVVTLVWFLSPKRYRQAILLTASIFFYATWQPLLIVVLFTCIVTAWAGGLLNSYELIKKNKSFITALTIVPVGILVFFKYYGFIAGSFEKAAQYLFPSFTLPEFSIALPVGISFFTFKTLSYIFDTRSGKLQPSKNPVSVANYIAFFPQILAGPIERGGNFIPQLEKEHRPDPERFRDGLALTLWGLFKKVVIADNLAVIVNAVYSSPQEHPGLVLITATYCFAFQILCDFSGYSDIAIGTAKILGFNTMRNFNRPYSASSVSNFWRRWHISLSSWFRDYLYIPLGGNRVSIPRWMINILIVFSVSGLWHGAGWSFIVWGCLHGLFLIGERSLTKPLSHVTNLLNLDKAPKFLKYARVIITFHLVTFAWIFFRAQNIDDAFYITTHLFDGLGFSTLNLLPYNELLLSGFLIIILLAAQFIRRNKSGMRWLLSRPLWFRWGVYAGMVLSVINLRPLVQAGFIYLRF
ncbi:MAG: MBOAT family O-acyltransferase [Chitinivibrionales bacterium]